MKKQYFIVDCHIHGVFRNPEQGWAARCREEMYDLLHGTLDEIIRYMDELGIAAGWVMPAWPGYGMRQAAESKLPKDLSESERAKANEEIKAKIRDRLERINLTNCEAGKMYPRRIAPFISLDPYFGAEWCEKEVEEKAKLGARGVKLLPDWGHYFPYDRTLWPAYKKAEELGMVLLGHGHGFSGTLWGQADTQERAYTWPLNYGDVARDFPKLPVVLAHLGTRSPTGWESPEAQLELAQRYPNVYYDISACQEIRINIELIRQVGIDRVLWGSDWGAHRHSMGLLTAMRCGLSEEEKRKLLGENARRLIIL